MLSWGLCGSSRWGYYGVLSHGTTNCFPEHGHCSLNVASRYLVFAQHRKEFLIQAGFPGLGLGLMLVPSPCSIS